MGVGCDVHGELAVDVHASENDVGMDARGHSDARGHGSAGAGGVADGIGAVLLDHQHGYVLGVSASRRKATAVLVLQILVAATANASISNGLQRIVGASRATRDGEPTVVGLHTRSCSGLFEHYIGSVIHRRGH